MNIAHNTKVDIYFHHSGLIEITACVTHILGIDQGDAINIYQDQNENYLSVHMKKPLGSFKGICRPSKRGSKFMRLNWAELSRKMIALSGVGQKAAYYRVGEPITIKEKILLPIITKNNLYND